MNISKKLYIKYNGVYHGNPLMNRFYSLTKKTMDIYQKNYII
jgi:hypothetical protein